MARYHALILVKRSKFKKKSHHVNVSFEILVARTCTLLLRWCTSRQPRQIFQQFQYFLKFWNLLQDKYLSLFVFSGTKFHRRIFAHIS